MSGLRIAAIFGCMAASVVFAGEKSSLDKPDQEVPVEVRDAQLISKNALAYRGGVKPLGRIFAQAEEGGEVRIAVVGGSITEGARTHRKAAQGVYLCPAGHASCGRGTGRVAQF